MPEVTIPLPKIVTGGVPKIWVWGFGSAMKKSVSSCFAHLMIFQIGVQCETLEKSSNMQKIWQKMKKSLACSTYIKHTFFGSFRMPKTPISGNQSVDCHFS